MSEKLWMLLLATVAIIPTAIYLQGRYKNQSLEEERNTWLEEKEKLSNEASQLKQQMTQMKEKQHETDRESRRSSAKVVALEEKVERLEDERAELDDEKDTLLIREKHLKQQHEHCKSQLTEAEAATTEEIDRRLRSEAELDKLTKELLQCKHETIKQGVLLSMANARSSTFKEKEDPTTGNSVYSAYPVLVKQFKTKAALEDDELITGIATLREDIFVVTFGSNVIERFDLLTLKSQQTITLTGYTNLIDIQSCNQSEILFVIEKDSTGKSSIASVDPYNLESLHEWAVGSFAERLSVTEDCHVVVALPEANKINEYSSTGHLLREIILGPETGIVRPRFALKMNNGNFLVSYDGSDRRIGVGLVILNVNGDVLKSYSGSSQTREFVNSVASDGLGNILVAEMLDGRVVLLSSDLEYRRELVSKEYGTGLIMSLLLDKVNGRFFAADCNFNIQGRHFDKSRILVFDLM